MKAGDIPLKPGRQARHPALGVHLLEGKSRYPIGEENGWRHPGNPGECTAGRTRRPIEGLKYTHGPPLRVGLHKKSRRPGHECAGELGALNLGEALVPVTRCRWKELPRGHEVGFQPSVCGGALG